ncbi:MAG: DinB family protein, partial [Gammaproteobacteria bacterium]
MNSVALLEQLQQQQQCVLNHCIQTQPNYKIQYHPDLSPAGWHLGHCIFTENYWVKEVLLAVAACDEALKSLYIPENSPKAERGKALPEYHELCEWAENTQTENRKLLREVLNNNSRHELMRNDYLIKFLMQHYAQHYETLQIISAQAALAKTYEFIVKDPLQSSQLICASRTISP